MLIHPTQGNTTPQLVAVLIIWLWIGKDAGHCDSVVFHYIKQVTMKVNESILKQIAEHKAKIEELKKKLR